MNIKEIKELLQLMAEHGLTEIEIEKDGETIKLKKASPAIEAYERIAEIRPAPVQISKGRENHGGSPQIPVALPQESEDVALVRSPMVGTLYAAPAPDQPTYVTVGKLVEVGDVLCIIEAMKLMNEIKSEVRGTLLEVLAENGHAVEFDQPIFKIKKA